MLNFVETTQIKISSCNLKRLSANEYEIQLFTFLINMNTMNFIYNAIDNNFKAEHNLPLNLNRQGNGEEDMICHVFVYSPSP